MSSRLLLLCATLATAAVAAEPAAPVFNRPPLQPTPFANLPLGSVRAQGWLKTQLELQRDGLTGNAETVIPELGPDSGWRGGKGESWEKGPYYLKGLVALAWTLDDAALKKRAQGWIDAILASQQADGFYGPGDRAKVDWWPRMVVDWALKDYADATGDGRVAKHLAGYYRYMAAHLAKRPLFDWGKARAGDEMDTVFWLYNRTGDRALLEVAELLRKQAWDWSDIYANNRFQHFGTFYTFHNVNVPQAFKFPLMAWQLGGEARDRSALAAGWAHLERDHGLAFGMTAGTEFLSGNSPTQATEMCSFVEQMLSFYLAVRTFGESAWADRAERIAFNGMPAGITKDWRRFQYYTYPNEVVAKRGHQGFNQDYEDGIIPGPHSGFHCCCYNLHMGWPMLAQHAWMASADGGLAAVIHAPTTVSASVAGTPVSIAAVTDYPFGETITYTVTVAKPTAFPLHLRIPGWCAQPAVAVNGQTQAGITAGGFHVVRRTWSTGDTVTLSLPMAVAVQAAVLNSVVVERGPLVYALRIGEGFKPLNQEPHGYDDCACESTTPWNYALAVTPGRSDGIAVDKRAMPANPFLADTTPVRLTAKARRLAAWTLAANGRTPLDPPVSPVTSDASEETVTLVPIGATTLHLTNLPWLGTPAPAPTAFRANFDDGTLVRWMLYGGNAMVRDGKLVLGPDNGYLKAVVPALNLRDLVMEADVVIGSKGNGGFMLRATQVGCGPDAYHGYYVGIDANRRCVEVGKADGSRWQSLGTAPAPVEAGKQVHLKVEATGDRFRVFVGDMEHPVHEFTDGDHALGVVGVREYGAKQFTVDNVVVTGR